MNPASQGNSSGLIVACTFSSTGVSAALTISDYADAVWHFGAARTVAVGVTRTGTNPGTVSGSNLKTCATNNTATAATCFGVASSNPAGSLALGTGPNTDFNHSVENPASSATLTAQLVSAGSFVKAVSGTTITLSKPLITTGWPNCVGTYVSGCTSAPVKVLVSNDSGRTLKDGVTAASSATVTSATAHFCGGASTCTGPSDVGKTFSGGDLPDGSTISTVNSLTSVTLTCTGCIGGFTGVSAASALVIAMSNNPQPTSARYVTNGSTAGTKVITSTTAEFANSDIGLNVTFNPVVTGVCASCSRITAVAADGSTATVQNPVNLPTGTNRKFTIGSPTKTAPATKDVAGFLAILLQVNPSVSPTSPPCAANKVSGFQIPLLWMNPGAYNTTIAAGTNQFSGSNPDPTSIAQFDFNTSATSFSGYLKQNYTTTSGVNGPSTYQVHYTFLPVTIGLCPGTGDATTWNFGGLSLKNAQVPSFTAGGGGGMRGITAEPQGTSPTYSGASGAQVSSTAAEQPSNNNACTVPSPSVIQVGC
jgi:hypothetical protein